MKINSIIELINIINSPNKILITSEDIKKEILMSSTKITHQKIITKSEFYDSLFIDKIDTKILIETELLSSLKLKYNKDLVNRIYNLLAFSYLQNIDCIYTDFVKEHNLISVPILYKTHSIYMFDIESEYSLLIKDINIIDIKFTQHKLDLNMFETELEEIGYVSEQISNLIESGVDAQNILIKTSYDSDKINLVFNTFGLLFNVENNFNLIRTNDFKKLVSELENNYYNNIEDIYKNYSHNNDIVQLLNKYVGKSNFLNILITDLKTKKQNAYISNNNIMKISDIPIVSENKHIFVLGLEKDNIVNNKTENNSLSKSEQILLNLSSDDILTNISHNNFKSIIFNSKNITISSNKNVEKLYEFDYEIINKQVISNSHSFNSLLYKKNREIKRKYNITTDVYMALKDLNVDSVVKSTFDSKIEISNINLSATSINDFVKCPFKFYLSKILKIKSNENTIQIIIGNFIHKFLELVLKDINVDTDKLIDQILNEEEFEQLIIFKKQLYKYLNQLVEVLDYQQTNSKFMVSNLEYKLQYKITNNVLFEGVVDKIMKYNGNGIVVDYKTGNSELKLKNVENKTDLQNAIYLNILSKVDSDTNYVATFKQHIKPNISSKNNNDYLQNYILNGIMSDGKYLMDLCSDIENNSFIKGLSLLKSGEIKKSNNIINSDEFNKLISSVDTIIDDLIDDVFNNNFEITELINGNDSGCKYCKFSDICFKNYLNTKHVGEVNNV